MTKATSARSQQFQQQRLKLGNVPFAIWMVLIALLGGIAGIGTYTFIFTQGTSYLSDDPRTCANCHIMRPVYAFSIDYNHARGHYYALVDQKNTQRMQFA
jgi:nitrate/TMAO reductase-like tetraheme cytochrome c subunit